MAEYLFRKDNRVDISLDMFEKQENGSFIRYEEAFSEIAPEMSVIEDILKECGMEIAAKYDYDTLDPVREDSEKVVYAARKIR